MKNVIKYGQVRNLNFGNPKIPDVKDGKVTYERELSPSVFEGSLSEAVKRIEEFMEDGWTHISEFYPESKWGDTQVNAVLRAEVPATEQQLAEFNAYNERILLSTKERELKQFEALKAKYGTKE